MTWEIRQGDCLEVMRTMDADSIDAICTDPPYALEFMGRDWKKEAQTMAQVIFASMVFADLDHNVAEAILIGRWASYAGEVGALPGVKVAG